MSAPRITSGDRLGATLTLSLIGHGVVLLGVAGKMIWGLR